MFKILLSTLLVSLVLAEPLRLPIPKHPRGRYPNYSKLVKDSTAGNFIVGGRPATIQEFPHQCSIRRSSLSCGCSIISDTWILTAAHCIDGASPSSLTIRVGTTTHASGGQDYKVAQLIAHPSYSSWTLDNDIGLIKLASSIALDGTTTKAIQLAGQDEPLPDGTVVTVTGWGATSEGGSLPTGLQAVEVPVVGNDKCQEKYSGFNDITAQMFCAGVDEGGKDSCQGDSGGPVVSNGKLVGAVSWGYGCARVGYPGVYARVASFRKWITDNSGV